MVDLAALGWLGENYSSSLIQFSSRRRTSARSGRTRSRTKLTLSAYRAYIERLLWAVCWLVVGPLVVRQLRIKRLSDLA